MPRMKDSRYFLCPMCDTYTAVLKSASDWSRKYNCLSCNKEFQWFDGSQPIRKDGQLVGFTRNFRGDV